MTLGLTMDTTLSRVQIALTNRADGIVHVERSVTPGFEKPVTVRGGRALPVTSGAGALDDYEFPVGKTGDIEVYYRVTPVSPEPGLLLTGESGDYASTPDTSALDITGNIDIRVDVTVDDWSVEQTLISKFLATGNQRSWRFGLVGGQLIFDWSPTGVGGVPAATTTEFETPDAGTRMLLRVTLTVNVSGDWQCRFFRGRGVIGSTDSADWELIQLVTGSPNTSIFNSSAAVEIGSISGGTGLLLKGVVHSAQVLNGINGPAVVDVDFAAQEHRDTGFTDDAGRTWTVNGDATIESVEIDSITPTLEGKLWFKSVWFPGQNFAAYRVLDRGQAIDRESRDVLLPIEGRMLPLALVDQHGGRGFVLPVQAPDQEAADRLDLVFSTGRVWFIHVPPELHGKVSGGYYTIRARQARGNTQERWVFELECRECAPPGPDVVGTVLTGSQLVAAHGSADSVWNAYPTVRDMWDTPGSLDDLVVV